jgi:hypothetical protein
VKREEVIGLKALADVLKDRLANFTPGSHRIEFPGPKIVNEVKTPEVTVIVDMKPVAEALERMSDVAAQQTAALVEHAKVMEKLIEKFANQPAPVIEFKPVVNVPESVVNVSAPIVKVEVPKQERKTLVVKHGDGTESRVTEED